MATASPPNKRRPPHRSFDPRLTPEPDVLARALVAQRAGRYHEAAELYQYLDSRYTPHWHARMMTAVLFYSRSSDPYFEIDVTHVLNGKPVVTKVTPMSLLQDVILNVPKWPDPRYNMGVILEGLGDYSGALKRFQQCVDIDPGYGEAWTNLGNCRLALGDHEGARVAFDTALAMNPDDPLTKYNLLHALALIGEWDEAYRLFEYRYLIPGHLQDCGLPRIMPQWNGRDYVDRLIVSDEQGAGDIIQFARFLPLVEARVGSVAFRCRHAHLTPLLKWNFPTVEFFDENDKVPDGDAHLPLLSSVHRLDVHEKDVPLSNGYLTPPNTTTVATTPGIVWRHPTSNTTAAAPRAVGVCWAGSPSHKRDGTRSIPFEVFRPILDTPGVQFVNLTVGTRAAVEHPQLTHPPLGDYAETARIMSTLDLIVTVDTSVLHLGGALGIPTWGLIAAAPDFRWSMGRSDTPWYRSVRLVRQAVGGDWSEAIARVAQAITAAGGAP